MLTSCQRRVHGVTCGRGYLWTCWLLPPGAPPGRRCRNFGRAAACFCAAAQSFFVFSSSFSADSSNLQTVSLSLSLSLSRVQSGVKTRSAGGNKNTRYEKMTKKTKTPRAYTREGLAARGGDANGKPLLGAQECLAPLARRQPSQSRSAAVKSDTSSLWPRPAPPPGGQSSRRGCPACVRVPDVLRI